MSWWSELQDRTLFKGHHEIAFQVVYSQLTQIVVLFVGKHDDIRSCPSIDVKKTTTILIRCSFDLLYFGVYLRQYKSNKVIHLVC